MHTRLARPTDAPLILSLALSEESHLIRDPDWPSRGSLLRTLASAVIPVARQSRVWIGRERGCDVMLEVRPRRYAIAWDIVRLNMRGNGQRVLPQLFAALTTDMQHNGVPRLFARCDDTTADNLRPYGFEPLARELVLLGPASAPGGDADLPAGSRYRMPQDAWPLHQLEHEVTPPVVRQVEGISSLDWAESKRGGEIVVERDGRVVAWIGWRRGKEANQPMGILLHPEHDALGSDLIRHALRQLDSGRALVRVREYQVETLDLLRREGFAPIGEETLVVKHARVVPARAKLSVARNVAGLPSMHAFRAPASVAESQVLPELHA